MMTVNDVANMPQFKTIVQEEDRSVETVFCCDMLSVAMGKAPSDSAWVTVMGNKNVIAVAVLADVSCVIAAEGCGFDAQAVEAARGKVSLLQTDLPVFDAALLVHQAL